MSCKNVEVLYDDGKWYWGWLDSLTLKLAGGFVKFQDDNETAEVLFPDKDIRLYVTNYFYHNYGTYTYMYIMLSFK